MHICIIQSSYKMLYLYIKNNKIKVEQFVHNYKKKTLSNNRSAKGVPNKRGCHLVYLAYNAVYL